MMLACRATGSPTLSVAAMGLASDVTTDVGDGRTASHTANDVQWYYSTSWSWGFAPAGETIDRFSCDTEGPGNGDRLCWHTVNNEIDGGWRCGATTGLNTSSSYERLIYTRTGPLQ